MRVALLRAASNNPHAVGRSYYTFDVSARIRGLCPHVKNRPLGGRMFIRRCREDASGQRPISEDGGGEQIYDPEKERIVEGFLSFFFCVGKKGGQILPLLRAAPCEEAGDGARVSVNGRPVKASYQVKVGDVLEIAFGKGTLKVEVTDVRETAPKAEAGAMYRELP